MFIQNSSSCLNVSNSKLAFIVRCACARRSSKQATASAPTKEAATTLTKHDKTWQNQGDTKESLAFDSLWRGSQAVTRSVQQVAGLQSCHRRHRRGLLHRQVSNVFRCVKPETIVQVPFKSTYLPPFLNSLWRLLTLFGFWWVVRIRRTPKPPLLAAAAPNKPPLLLAPQEQFWLFR